MKKSLAISAGALLLLAGVLAYVLLKPDPEPVSYSATELLADGIGHFDRKEYDLALEVLQQVPDGLPESAQAIEPRNTGVLYALGVAYYKLGNLAVAKGYFGAVLEINPNDEQAKGLMDIMARLERQSSEPAETE